MGGMGVPEDLDAGMDWLHCAADQGHVEAMFWLGKLLFTVLEIIVDAGMDWLHCAADQGRVEAMFWLGKLLFPIRRNMASMCPCVGNCGLLGQGLGFR